VTEKLLHRYLRVFLLGPDCTKSLRKFSAHLLLQCLRYLRTILSPLSLPSLINSPLIDAFCCCSIYYTAFCTLHF
jgi:hypothetical protein